MGRTTLKELMAMREERVSEREAELHQAELEVLERRREHLAERRYLGRLMGHEHEGQAMEFQAEEDTRRALHAQARSQWLLEGELRDLRWAISEEAAELHACRRVEAELIDRRRRLYGRGQADIGSLRRELAHEHFGGEAVADHITVLRGRLAKERDGFEAAARAAWSYAGGAIREEAAASDFFEEERHRAAREAQELKELQSEARRHEEHANREQILQEAAHVQRELEVEAYRRRTLHSRRQEAVATSLSAAASEHASFHLLGVGSRLAA